MRLKNNYKLLTFFTINYLQLFIIPKKSIFVKTQNTDFEIPKMLKSCIKIKTYEANTLLIKIENIAHIARYKYKNLFKNLTLSPKCLKNLKRLFLIKT